MGSGKRLAPQTGGLSALLGRLGFTNCLAVLLVLLLFVGLAGGGSKYQISVHRRPGVLDGGIYPHRHGGLHRLSPHCGQEPGGEHRSGRGGH